MRGVTKMRDGGALYSFNSTAGPPAAGAGEPEPELGAAGPILTQPQQHQCWSLRLANSPPSVCGTYTHTHPIVVGPVEDAAGSGAGDFGDTCSF